MLLKALYDYAKKRRLLDDLPLQKREIHALIPLTVDGKLRFQHLIAPTHTNEKGKERPGQEWLMPRFPGENNGGKAYFLAEGTIAVLGRDKETGESISIDPKVGKNSTKAFLDFWRQIQEAYDATKDQRLDALLAFQAAYLLENDGKIQADLPFLEVRHNKKGEPQLVAKSQLPDALPMKSATLGFSVDGQPLTLENENDPLRRYWLIEYARRAFQEASDEEEIKTVQEGESTLCLVTGQTGEPVARSHKPKILGIPGLASGGYIVSFAKDAPAFSSYGFEMGQNAPVSETVAAGYALALNELLDDEGAHSTLGAVAVCFWAKEVPQAARQFNFLMGKAYPKQVREFLRAPFAGIADREILKRDRLYTIALTGAKARVIVFHWLDQTLNQAVENFAEWWNQLQIVNFYPENALPPDEQTQSSEQKEPPSPYAIPNLARVTLRRSKSQKEEKLVSARIVELYRAALEGTAPPLSLLKPILDEFQSALQKDDPKKPTYPFNPSRFALIKLILIRKPGRKETDFMPQPCLAEDTTDAAYNLGRLLAVFADLQRAALSEPGKWFDGPGVVGRYYGGASSAPAATFPVLCKLHHAHLKKLRSRGDGGLARFFEERIEQILGRLKPDKPAQPPVFPRLLTLEGQGRFALGFYQQKAYRNSQDAGDKQPTGTNDGNE